MGSALIKSKFSTILFIFTSDRSPGPTYTGWPALTGIISNPIYQSTAALIINFQDFGCNMREKGSSVLTRNFFSQLPMEVGGGWFEGGYTASEMEMGEQQVGCAAKSGGTRENILTRI